MTIVTTTEHYGVVLDYSRVLVKQWGETERGVFPLSRVLVKSGLVQLKPFLPHPRFKIKKIPRHGVARDSFLFYPVEDWELCRLARILSRRVGRCAEVGRLAVDDLDDLNGLTLEEGIPFQVRLAVVKLTRESALVEEGLQAVRPSSEGGQRDRCLLAIYLADDIICHGLHTSLLADDWLAVLVDKTAENDGVTDGDDIVNKE